MSSIVIALGGNALGDTPYKQLKLIKDTAKPIVDLIEKGNKVTIVHGNGPQVGMINLGLAVASENNAIKSDMPFPECGAMSQGYIGYHLQNAILNELSYRGITKNVVTLVTQVEVDKDDMAFQNPTKPIGSFYTKEQADQIASEKGYVFKEDAGRGYRRVIASPKPIDVVEKEIVKELINNDNVVIACGGGGIPVVKNNNVYSGVPAVIDKDFAAAKLSEIIDADMLVILTAVDAVCINYNTENEIKLSSVSVSDLKKYIEEGHFAAGSMLPKVKAAIMFTESNPGKKAIIADLKDAIKAINGETGTVISL